MEEKKETVVELTEAEKIKHETISLIALGVTAVLSYKLGAKVNGAKINRGFDAMFKADPTFKEHYFEAFSKAMRMKFK